MDEKRESALNYPGTRFINDFFAHNSNSMDTSPCSNPVVIHQIATKFCTCNDSTAVVSCTKCCKDHCIRIEVRVKWNFHRIWIAMEKPLVKRGLDLFVVHLIEGTLLGALMSSELRSNYRQNDNVSPNGYRYSDVIMGTIGSQITSLAIVYSTVYSGADKKNIKAPRHWRLWPMNSPHKWPVTRKMLPFDDVIMCYHDSGGMRKCCVAYQRTKRKQIKYEICEVNLSIKIIDAHPHGTIWCYRALAICDIYL